MNLKSRIAKLLLGLEQVVVNLSQRGYTKPTAMGFYESAWDVGPITFLSNADYEMGDTEIQVFGHAIWHTFSSAYGELMVRLFHIKVFEWDCQEDESLFV